MPPEEEIGSQDKGDASLGWVVVNLIGRVWLPVAVFGVFLAALLYRPEVYELFLENSRWVSVGLFTYGVQIGAWLSLGFLVNRLITVFFWDGFIGGISERRVPRLPKDVTAILIFSVVALAIASTVFDKDTTKIIAASGAVSVVVGLALRTVILDLFMGLAIHVDRPFKLGDWIMVHQNRVETHIVAEVIEVNWRTTRLRTTKNNMVVVPNSRLGETIVTNYMEPKPHFRLDLDFTIDFEVPSERAIRVLKAGIRAATEHRGILDKPEPEVRMKESTLEGMVYEVRYFILPKHISPNDSKHVVNQTVLEHLIHSGIMPAHSKEEVFLSRRERRTLDSSLEEDLHQLLTRSQLFRELSAGEFKGLFQEMRKRTLEEGEVVYQQQEEGDSMFVCLEGLLSSSVNLEGGKGVKVQTIRAGQYFGEKAVLGDSSRNTTITTDTEVLLYEISREAFESVLTQHKGLRDQLQASVDKTGEAVNKKVKQVIEEMAAQPVARKKTAMQKVAQAFFPGMFDDDVGPEKKGGGQMTGNINRRQIKTAVLALILAGVALAKAQPIPGASFPPSRVKPWLQDALSQLAQLPDGTNSVKIVSQRLTLSYTDPLRAVQLLALHGYTIGKLDAPIISTNLPVVVALVGTTNTDTVPEIATKFPQTETDPVNELVVFHDENDPSQLSGFMATIKNDIDRPARQMIIEAMILEVSSTALKELGVKWTRASGAKEGGNFLNSKLSNLVVGSVRNPATDVTLDLSTKGIFHDLNTQIKALVREGEAEILSRPSVLALDNRMAYISVAEDIPIARSSYAKNDYQSTSFAKEKAGITLALRPRIDSKGQEVSMQVNAEVTAKVPDGDLVVKNKDGMILASAPTISRREVKTYVRVANNTPFIIGGLIAKDKQSTVDKVPLLGDIPLLGALFRSKKLEAVNREVIIVLTPFVLPEEHITGKNMPKDEDAFDSVDNQLFRDAYRIRAEDTFDLNYLYENKQLQRMKALANRIVATDVKLASEYPYSQFVYKAVPGEAILCYRQIYEVLKRRGMQNKLNSTKLIFFEPDRNIGLGHRVQFLEEYIRKNAPEVLTEKGGSKGVLLTFDMKRDSDDAKSIFNEPVPQVKLVDCTDQEDWSKQLWELNQPKENGGEQFSVLLREKKDMERLKYAVLMKKTVELNTEELVLTLSSFTRGRLLLMPRVKEQDVELIDGDVARAFFYSEMYYQALQKEMEKDLAAFRKVIEEKNHLKKLIKTSPRP